MASGDAEGTKPTRRATRSAAGAPMANYGQGRLAILFVGALLVTPAAARAESVLVAAFEKALAEAHCPTGSRANAVEATSCRLGVLRLGLVEDDPAALKDFKDLEGADLTAARSFAAGRISAQQYLAEERANATLFVAKQEARDRTAACTAILTVLGKPGIEPALQAAALKKQRNMGCLRQ
jgi:hypothetical protein